MSNREEQSTYYQKNLEILRKTDPLLVHQLDLIDPSNLSFCKTEQNEFNLVRLFEGQYFYYHSPLSAINEAHAWFQALDLHSATVIFVYGVGLGYYYLAAKEWLARHPHNRLIFLEENLEVMYRLCETELGSQLLSDFQVNVVFLRDTELNKLIFNEFSWDFCNQSFIITSLKLYERIRHKTLSQLKHDISFQFDQKNGIVNEYLHFGLTFFRNFYLNLFELPHAYLGNGLFGRFSQVPAIICGAGPSLNKNMKLLPELKDRALIFAGGSALNALIPNGIVPHFGVGIDPHPSQYSRTAALKSHSIPFFYRQRLYHEALLTIHSARLYLTGSGGYRISEWFEKELGITGENLDEGYNVVNFSIQIARALGCNPIILVGTDLAYTNQQDYAVGVITNVNEINEKNNGIKDPDITTTLVLKEDINGKPIYTSWKWITEAEWISAFSNQNPELLILNATEGGIGFKDIANLTLKEASDKFLNIPHEEIAKIDHEISKHSLKNISTSHIFELVLQMKKSLEACILLLSKLIEETDKIADHIKNEEAIPPLVHSPKLLILQNTFEDEVGYRYLLEKFSQVFNRLHDRERQELILRKHTISEKAAALKKLELEKQCYVFLRDVSRCNCNLIGKHLAEKKH